MLDNKWQHDNYQNPQGHWAHNFTISLVLHMVVYGKSDKKSQIFRIRIVNPLENQRLEPQNGGLEDDFPRFQPSMIPMCPAFGLRYNSPWQGKVLEAHRRTVIQITVGGYTCVFGAGYILANVRKSKDDAHARCLFLFSSMF